MSKDNIITVTGTPLAKALAFNALHNTVVKNTITAPAEVSDDGRSSRAPLDLVAVLDVSGSMSGYKLHCMSQTLVFLIEQLKPSDRLAIVSFSSGVTLELMFTEMSASGKEMAKNIANRLRAMGGTNLSSGLIKGLELVKERQQSKHKNDVVSMLLLTDGSANEGIQDLAGITAVTKQFLEEITDPLSINTFGFGADHVPEFMTGIAESANGMFFYIEKTEDIAAAFVDCVGGLLSVVAQNIELTVQSSEGTKITKVQTPFKQTEVEKGHHYVIKIPNLFAEEQRDILFEIDIPVLSAAKDKSVVLRSTVSYDNLRTKTRLTSNVCETSIERPERVEKPEINTEVLKHVYRIQTTTALEEAIQAGQRHDVTKGNSVLANMIKSITESPIAKEADCQNMVNSLQQAQQSIQNFSHGGSAAMNAHYHGHAQQRANPHTSNYRNACQSQMQEAQQAYFSAPPPQQQILQPQRNYSPSSNALPQQRAYGQIPMQQRQMPPVQSQQQYSQMPPLQSQQMYSQMPQVQTQQMPQQQQQQPFVSPAQQQQFAAQMQMQQLQQQQQTSASQPHPIRNSPPRQSTAPYPPTQSNSNSNSN